MSSDDSGGAPLVRRATNRLRIGSRLGLSFAALALLMGLGGVIALWQFRLVRAQDQRQHQAEQRVQAALRVHGDVLAFREDLDALMDTRKVGAFVARATPRGQAFLDDVERAIRALGDSPSGEDTHEAMRQTLETIRIELPAQIDAVVALARVGEWAAVRRRLDGQLKSHSRVTAAMVEEIDREVRREQADVLSSTQRVQRQAVGTLWVVGLLTVLVLGALGVAVTRSITRPLRRLDAAAQALARGEFEHRVVVTGNDELANLGAVFNQSAFRLRELYGALQRSEEHFRSLIENASDLIMVLGPEGTIRYVSPSSPRVLGGEPGTFVGRPVFDLIASREAAGRLRSVLAGMGQEAARPIEASFRHADGSRRVLEATVSDLLANAAVRGIVVNWRDVTERKAVEEALRASEERYRALYEDTPSMYFTVDPQGLVVSVNQFGATYLGYTVEELVGHSVLRVFVEEDKAAATAHVAECLAQPERVFEWKLRKVRKDGSRLWVRETARAVWRPETGSAVLIVCEDITERMRADEVETQLRALLENAAVEWETTFDSIETPILILTAGGQVARSNRAAAQLAAGAGCLEMQGRPVAEVGPGEPWQNAGSLATEVAKSRQPVHGQARDPASDRTWDVAASPSTGPADDERVIVVARDVTRMVDLQESLRRSETLSAMGTLVAGVAHEVRNPLFSISANLDAFESRYGKEGEHAGIITLLRSETSRLVSLMNDLLDYGRPGREKPAPQHLEDVATQAVSACASLASHHRVRVLNRISPGLGPVVMDRKRIAQVLQNLLANAVQHSPEGGTVTIEAQEVGARDQAWLECSVSDSGPGFPPEDLPRIFEPFFTRRRGGTGLGLSIVQRIMEMHGGTIVAANRPQGGAIVSLRLPRLGPDGRRSDAAGV